VTTAILRFWTDVSHDSTRMFTYVTAV